MSIIFERSYGLMLNNETSIGIYRYFHLNREKDIFSNLTQLDYDSADEYLAYIKKHNLAVKSYNEHYLRRRFDTEKAIYDSVISHHEVLSIDLLQTRIFGNKIYVDIEIVAKGDKTLREAHEIAESVHDSIEKNFPKVKHIMVHVNPV